MTIYNDEELRRTHDALGDLYRALAALRREYEAARPEAFAVLSEGPLQEIHRLQAEVDEYTGLTSAQSEQAPLWLTVSGERAKWGETPSSVLTAFLDALRRGVQLIAGFELAASPLGRPQLELQRACDFELVAFQPGSLRVGLRLPESGQLTMFEDQPPARAQVALNQYLKGARWAGSTEPVAVLEEGLSDAARRRVVLRAVKLLVPRAGGGVDAVDLSGRAVRDGGSIQLTQAASGRITLALEEALTEEEERYEGDVREMDLDRRTFKLRHVEQVSQVECRFSKDAGALIGTYLGKRVRLIGVRRADTRSLEVVDIEVLAAGPRSTIP